MGYLPRTSAVSKGHLCASKEQQSFFFKRPALYTFVMTGGEISIAKALLLDGFLRKLGSRNLQTQAVLLGKIGPTFTSLRGEL